MEEILLQTSCRQASPALTTASAWAYGRKDVPPFKYSRDREDDFRCSSWQKGSGAGDRCLYIAVRVEDRASSTLKKLATWSRL